jgi:aspartyl protease family protein
VYALSAARQRQGGWATGLSALAWCCAFIASIIGTPAKAVESIHVVGLFTNKAVVQVDGKRRVLAVGKPSPEGVVLISATSESAVLEVDGTRSTFRLGRQITTVFRAPAERPAMQIWPSARGMYSLVGSINGYPVNFLVDTGATLIAMNKNEARRLGIDYVVDGTPSRASTASGVVNTYLIRLARVKIGEIELRDVDASVVDGAFPREVLLGNSFLNRLEMRREGRMLELRKRP